jgi:hypothetical protein
MDLISYIGQPLPILNGFHVGLGPRRKIVKKAPQGVAMEIPWMGFVKSVLRTIAPITMSDTYLGTHCGLIRQ